jgi:hypothetical protein
VKGHVYRRIDKVSASCSCGAWSGMVTTQVRQKKVSWFLKTMWDSHVSEVEWQANPGRTA